MRGFPSRRAAALLALTGIACPSLAQQEDSHWIGGFGSWADASNWSTDPFAPQNGIPLGTTYRVVLDAKGAFYQITLSSDRTIDEMVVDSPDAFVVQDDGSLRVLGDITVTAGAVTLQGDRLRSANVIVDGGAFGFGSSVPFVLEDVTLTGDFSLAGTTRIEGNFDLTGSLTFGASSLLLPDSRTFDNCTFELGQGNVLTTGGSPDPLQVVFEESTAINAGPSSLMSARETDSWTNHGSLTATGVSNGDGLRIRGFHFENGATGRVLVTGDPSLLEIETMTWENDGTMGAEGGGELRLISEAGGINRGTIEATDGEVLLVEQWTNEGTIRGTRAIINFGAQPGGAFPPKRWGNSGVIIGVDSQFNLGGIFSPTDLGNLLLIGDSSLHITGELDNVGATLVIDQSSPRWFLDQGTITGGRIETAGGARLKIVNSGRLLDTTVAGDLALIGARPTFTIGDDLTLESGSFFVEASDAELVFNSTKTLDDFEIFVRIDPQYGNRRSEVQLRGNHDLHIGPTSLLHGNTTIGLRNGTSPNGQILLNHGTISADDPTGFLSISTPIFTNEGVCEAINGSVLQIVASDSWTNNGTISVVDSTAELGSGGGGAPWTNAGIISGINAEIRLGGVLRTTDFGTVQLDDTSFVSLQGVIDLEGGTFELTPEFGDWRSGSARFVNGTFSTAPGALLTVTNRVEFENVVVDADFSFSDGADVIVHGQAEFVRPLNLRGAEGNLLDLRGPTTLQGGVIDTPQLNTTDDSTIGKDVVLTIVSGRIDGRDKRLTLNGELILEGDVDGDRIWVNAGDLVNTGRIQLNDRMRGDFEMLTDFEPLRNEGEIELGIASRLTINRVLFTETSVLILPIEGPNGEGTARLIADEAQLGGEVRFELLSGRVPEFGESFHVFDFGFVIPPDLEFDSIVLPALPPDRFWDTSKLNTDGHLRVRAFNGPSVSLGG